MPAILFVEDDATIAMGVEYSLKQDGFQVSLAYRLEEARGLLKRSPFDLVLLDLGLPDGSGYELCKEIRAAGDTPIIILSARDEEASIVLGLDLGADDYLTKPFGVAELAARMRVCLRHCATRSQDELQAVFRTEGLFVDLAKRHVSLNDHEVRLTKIEFKLLSYLVHNAGKVVTHRQILKAVWDSDREDQLHYSRIYVRQLRNKIEPNPATPCYLLTETGVGYRLIS